MEEITLYQIICFFFIYSAIGWAVEVAYHAVSVGRIINRGFLNGPVCPIYGFGVVSILLLLRFLSRNHPEVFHAAGIFVIGTILSTAVELFGGWILDKVFHARWWDYRDRKYNLNGYICPQFSLIWGCGILIVVRIVHPFVRDAVILPSEKIVSWIAILAVCIVFFVDFTTSVLIMIGLNKKFGELDEIQRKLRVVSDRASVKIGEDTLKGVEKIEQIKQDAQFEAQRDEIFNAIKSHKFLGAGRVLFGNPTFYHRDFHHYVREIKKNHSIKNG